MRKTPLWLLVMVSVLMSCGGSGVGGSKKANGMQLTYLTLQTQR